MAAKSGWGRTTLSDNSHPSFGELWALLVAEDLASKGCLSWSCAGNTQCAARGLGPDLLQHSPHVVLLQAACTACASAGNCCRQPSMPTSGAGTRPAAAHLACGTPADGYLCFCWLLTGHWQLCSPGCNGSSRCCYPHSASLRSKVHHQALGARMQCCFLCAWPTSTRCRHC